MKNLVGEKFGKLTVTKIVKHNKKMLWECQCDCGNKIYTNTCRLTTGHNRSCGCIKKLDLIGKKYGKLLVIKKLESNKHKKRIWECKCDCGKIINITTSILKKQKSCGCGRAITIKQKMWKGYGKISGSYWSSIRLGAKSRSLEFNISIEDAWEIFLLQKGKCSLTGIDLIFRSHSSKADGTASLDRIDSKLGYIKNNIQWIHKDVNQMKMNLKENYFIDFCKKISKNSDKQTNIIKFKKLDKKAIIPKYQTAGSAGFDFHAVIDKISYHGEVAEEENDIVIEPGQQKVIKTGLSVEIPQGWQMEIRPRSGLAFKHSITITNAPGTCDADFRGEIKIILYNLGKENFIIKNGDRIAQGVIMPAPQFDIVEANELESTERGTGGFGSTGI